MAEDINNRGKLVTLPPIAPTMHRATCLFTLLTSLGFGAILARSSREISLTVRIVRQYILSRDRVTVRPSIFCLREKLP